MSTLLQVSYRIVKVNLSFYIVYNLLSFGSFAREMALIYRKMQIDFNVFVIKAVGL